ncbi:MAG TPA: metallophosphoesterase family protein [Burkholderiales bacterium]|nr:metallophosphoesterase family protein [Burkholderiales bacterium]
MRIGLISDTHGVLRPEALAYLEGSERIIHAGDIMDPEILVRLGRIAPVTAVRGNNDFGSWAERIPETAVLRAGAVSIFVVHDLATLKGSPRDGGHRVVVAGHSHKPRVEESEGVLFVNPGSAGPRRFSLPISAGELLVHGTQVNARWTALL